MSAPELDLAAVKARAEAATEGPWFVDRVGDFNDKAATIACVRWRDYVNNASFDEDFDTAEFIAHARTDVPALVAEVERLRFDLEQQTQRAGRAERYAQETDRLVSIIRDAQERLARPGKRLDDLRAILNRLGHEARQEREDRILAARDNTPITTRVAERAQLEAELDRLRHLIEDEIEMPAEKERDQARAEIAALRDDNERLTSLVRAIEDSRPDPARAIVKADRLAGEAIIRAHNAEAKLDALLDGIRALVDEYVLASVDGEHERVVRVDRLRALPGVTPTTEAGGE